MLPLVFQQLYILANPLRQTFLMLRYSSYMFDNDIDLLERRNKKEKRKLFRETILTYARQMRQVGQVGPAKLEQWRPLSMEDTTVRLHGNNLAAI
jgi:hypothetical protein